MIDFGLNGSIQIKSIIKPSSTAQDKKMGIQKTVAGM